MVAWGMRTPYKKSGTESRSKHSQIASPRVSSVPSSSQKVAWLGLILTRCLCMARMRPLVRIVGCDTQRLFVV